MQNRPYTEFVKDMLVDEISSKKAKEILQTLSKEMKKSVYAGNNRKDIID